MAIILGLDVKLLRGTAGATAVTKVNNIKDLTLKEAGLEFGSLYDTLEFRIMYDTEDADFTAFQTAYFSNTPMALFVTDGNGQGLDADWSIIGFSLEQPLEGAMSVSVIAKPNASTRAPSWMQ